MPDRDGNDPTLGAGPLLRPSIGTDDDATTPAQQLGASYPLCFVADALKVGSDGLSLKVHIDGSRRVAFALEPVADL